MNVFENIYTVHCDGGAKNNGSDKNIGAWGAVIEHNFEVLEIKNAVENTTNNKMELTACIESLKAIKDKDSSVNVISDSAYLINGMNKWTIKWLKNKWLTSKKQPVLNKEYWIELLSLAKEFRDIRFIKCKGHADNEGNMRADELVNIAVDEYLSTH